MKNVGKKEKREKEKEYQAASMLERRPSHQQHTQTQAGKAQRVFVLLSVVGTLLQTHCQNFLEAMAKATGNSR